MSSNGSAAAALEKLGRLALRDQSMEMFLQQVCDAAADVMPGAPETSVLLLVGDKPQTTVFTGQLALDCDERQYQTGQGPCLHAARTGELTEIADMQTETRWPDYVQQAAERGALSSLSIPLAISDGVSGALNIYARTPHAFDEESRAVGTRFGPYAAVALANMHAYQNARDMADNLQTALESRAVIDQAKGILMERYKFSADQAFQVLARHSMHSNQKLRTVADELVRTGLLPHLPSEGA
jgi:GAF domain-containing protein